MKIGTTIRFAAVLVLTFLTSTLAHSQPSVPGTYRLLSFALEVDGQPNPTFGQAPKGYAVLTATRFTTVITAEKRKFGKTVEDKAALWDSLIAYSGPYRLEGDRLITSVDTSWNESWNGTQQTRIWKLEGNRLHLTTVPAPYSRDPSKTAVARLVWERTE
jgi:Lipocalin-like domain